MKIKIGTRGSALARTQSTTIAEALRRLGHEPELVIIRTTGDDSKATSFGSIGAQGVFVREIEQALLDARVDLAVHSFKDLPTSSPDELVVAAVPTRVDPADVLVANREATDTAAGTIPLAAGSTVGTASARRQSWLRHLYPELKIEPLRGNVPTRIGKLRDGYDAIVLAAAGLERLQGSPLAKDLVLDLGDYDITRLHPRVFVPAPAQGSLALQCRRDAEQIMAALAALDDPVSHACVAAERALLARVEGGCDLALGAHCEHAHDRYELTAMIERDGDVLTESAAGADPRDIALEVWEALARR